MSQGRSGACGNPRMNEKSLIEDTTSGSKISTSPVAVQLFVDTLNAKAVE